MESMQHIEYNLLYKVNSPKDLKQLSLSELSQYCAELRQLSYSSMYVPQWGTIFEQAKPGISKASRIIPGAIQTAVRLENLNGDSEGT